MENPYDKLKEVDLDVNNHEEFELYDNSDDAFHEKDICVNDWVNDHEKVFDAIVETNFDYLDM